MNERQLVENTRKIYQMLGDEESKFVYMSSLAYVLSGDIRYAMGCIGTYMNRYVESNGYEFTPHNITNLLSKLPKDRKIVLYGAGGDGAMLLPFVRRDERFIGFCSATKEHQKNGYLTYPVISPEELLAKKNLSVVIASSNYRYDLMDILKDGGYPQELVFDAIPYYHSNPEESDQYFGPKFMKYEEEEVFVDAGCYDFLSSQALTRHCKCVKKVYAFEPDPDNYQKCLKAVERRNQKRIVDVRIFPNGVWSEKTMLHFDAIGSTSSRVSDEEMENSGGIVIPVVAIDDTIDVNDKVTMIKMDIEGSELEALKGAKKTIQRDKPKLAICIYHKPEDMWEIPLYIKKLVPEYRLYIRHYSNYGNETVLYAVIP